jgi:endoglucanase
METSAVYVSRQKADVETQEFNRRLGRGVNLGNALEAPEEGDWGVVLQEEYFYQIKQAGFDSVRIPVRWSAHADTEAPYTIDPEFFERVDWAVDHALANGLMVVLNVHHYEEIMADPGGHDDRLIAMWEQITRRYQSHSCDLAFEILNEPNNALTARRWNNLIGEALDTIRAISPSRIVIVGPPEWNGIQALGSLKLPENDRNLIVTFHYYQPFNFTHQGAEWASGSQEWLGTTWVGSDAEKRAVQADLDAAVQWAQANNRPLFMGEFGAYSRADMDSRARWTDFVARQAEKRNISWAYWEFGAGFGVYDPQRNAWIEPLREALLPADSSAQAEPAS